MLLWQSFRHFYECKVCTSRECARYERKERRSSGEVQVIEDVNDVLWFVLGVVHALFHQGTYLT